MRRFLVYSGIVILLALVFLGAFFSRDFLKTYFQKENKQTIIEPKTEEIKEEKNNDKNEPEEFFVSGWLPYWRKNEGVKSLENNLESFNQINPFAYGVNSDGSLADKMQLDSSPWPELFKKAKGKNVPIVPTILWGDAVAMHKIFANWETRDAHINAIAEMVEKNNFSGVDIDYEGKDISDRDNFTIFLRFLGEKLLSLNRKLSCTIEARTTDSPPAGFSGTRAMSWANDLPKLNSYCDTVRIMAYDQVFQEYRANVFEIPGENPLAPNASDDWVESAMEYALQYVQPEKLVLGVATYGWEFQVEKISGGWRYERIGSINYSAAMKIAKENKIEPIRTEGGELSFVYAGNHLIVFEDAESVRQKIEIAKKLNLKGISLFKIDGDFDPKIFRVLSDLQ